MIIPSVNAHSVFTPIQVQQATIPSPAEMPFLTAPVRKRSVFHYACSPRRALLRPIARETGSRIYLQEEPIYSFWCLNYGVVSLHHTLEDGKEMLVRAYQQGDWFGYLGLPGSEFYHCYAYVLQTASLCHIILHSNSDFLRYHPQLVQFLLSQVVAGLSDSEHRMTWTACYHTRYQVLSSLRYLTSCFPNYDWMWRKMVEFVGCETGTALRLGKEPRLTGMLNDLQRCLHICDPERLATILKIKQPEVISNH